MHNTVNDRAARIPTRNTFGIWTEFFLPVIPARHFSLSLPRIPSFYYNSFFLRHFSRLKKILTKLRLLPQEVS